MSGENEAKVAEGSMVPGLPSQFGERVPDGLPGGRDTSDVEEYNFAEAAKFLTESAIDSISALNLYRELDCTDIHANYHDIPLETDDKDVITMVTMEFERFGRGVDVREKPLGEIPDKIAAGLAREAIDEFESHARESAYSGTGYNAVKQTIEHFIDLVRRSPTDILVPENFVSDSNMYDSVESLSDDIESVLSTRVHEDETGVLEDNKILVVDGDVFGYHGIRIEVGADQWYEPNGDTFGVAAHTRRGFVVANSENGIVFTR